MLTSDSLQLKIMQAELVRGGIALSLKEMELLEQWLIDEKIEKAELQEFLKDIVLTQQPTALTIFESTPLGRFLESS